MSETLHFLIHSLGQAEKRYFRLFASRQKPGKPTNATQIFDEILLQETYDEEALKLELAGASFLPHLAAEKVQLSQMILKAMRNYHAGRSMGQQLHDLLTDLRFLMEKRLFTAATTRVKRGKKKARKYGEFRTMLALLDVERKLVKETERRNLTARMSQNMKERQETLKIMENEEAYGQLYDRLFLVVRQEFRLRNPGAETSLSEIMSDLLLADDRLALSFRAKLYFFLSHALGNQLLGELARAKQWYAKAVAIWDEHPHMAKEDAKNYQRSLSNYLASCQMTDDLGEFPAILQKLRKAKSSNPDEAATLFQAIYYNELLYFLGTHQFEAAAARAPEIRKGLDRFASRLNRAAILGFQYNLSLVFFFLEDQESALHWLRPILYLEASEHRQDIQRFARMLEMILIYDQGDLALAATKARSAYRYLIRQAELHGYEQTLLRFLRKLLNLPSGAAVKELFAQLRGELDLLAADPGSRQAPGLDELRYWLEARERGVGVWEVV